MKETPAATRVNKWECFRFITFVRPCKGQRFLSLVGGPSGLCNNWFCRGWVSPAVTAVEVGPALSNKQIPAKILLFRRIFEFFVQNNTAGFEMWFSDKGQFRFEHDGKKRDPLRTPIGGSRGVLHNDITLNPLCLCGVGRKTQANCDVAQSETRQFAEAHLLNSWHLQFFFTWKFEVCKKCGDYPQKTRTFLTKIWASEGVLWGRPLTEDIGVDVRMGSGSTLKPQSLLLSSSNSKFRSVLDTAWFGPSKALQKAPTLTHMLDFQKVM